MKAWTDRTWSLSIYKAESGWIVRRQGPDGRVMGEDVAGLSDDEGLLEWFAAQLGFDGHKLPGPSPQPGALGASAAAIVPPPVSAADLPLANFLCRMATAMRLTDDDYILANANLPTGYYEANLGQVRDLLRDAGLFTPDMLPRSDDDTGGKAGEDVPAVAPVRASDSEEDAPPAGASVADHPDTMQAAPAQAVAPSATPAAGDPPPADANDDLVDF